VCVCVCVCVRVCDSSFCFLLISRRQVSCLNIFLRFLFFPVGVPCFSRARECACVCAVSVRVSVCMCVQ
jgi:hypothetical protein